MTGKPPLHTIDQKLLWALLLALVGEEKALALYEQAAE